MKRIEKCSGREFDSRLVQKVYFYKYIFWASTGFDRATSNGVDSSGKQNP